MSIFGYNRYSKEANICILYSPTSKYLRGVCRGGGGVVRGGGELSGKASSLPRYRAFTEVSASNPAGDRTLYPYKITVLHTLREDAIIGYHVSPLVGQIPVLTRRSYYIALPPWQYRFSSCR